MSSQTIEHRLNLAVSNLSINTNLTPANYQQIRDMKPAGKGVMEVAKLMRIDRDQVSAIYDGLVHKTEYEKMTPTDQKKFRDNYLLPRIEKKMESENAKKSLTDEEFTSHVNMTNSMNKRKVKDLDVLIEILLYKFKINPTTKKLYSQQETLNNIRLMPGGEEATAPTICNTWNGNIKIYDEEFKVPRKITKVQYDGLVSETRERKTDPIKIADIVKRHNVALLV